MLEVPCPPWLAILFGDHHHPGTPSGGRVDRHLLQHPECYVAVLVGLDLLLPMQRNLYGGVGSVWLGAGLEMMGTGSPFIMGMVCLVHRFNAEAPCCCGIRDVSWLRDKSAWLLGGGGFHFG